MLNLRHPLHALIQSRNTQLKIGCTEAARQRLISKTVNDYFHILLKADIDIVKSTIRNDAEANAANPVNQSDQTG